MIMCAGSCSWTAVAVCGLMFMDVCVGVHVSWTADALVGCCRLKGGVSQSTRPEAARCCMYTQGEGTWSCFVCVCLVSTGGGAGALALPACHVAPLCHLPALRLAT